MESPSFSDYLQQEGYRASSIKTIQGHLKRLYLALGDTWDDPQIVGQYIEKLEAPSVKPALLNSLMIYWRYQGRDDVVQALDPLYQEYKKRLVVASQHRVPTKAGRFISIQKLQALATQLATQTDIDIKASRSMNKRQLYKIAHWWTKYLLVLLYARAPPVRLEEYRQARVVDSIVSLPDLIAQAEQQGHNVLSLTHRALISTVYKTSRLHDSKVMPLPEIVMNEITRWIQWRRAVYDSSPLLFPDLVKLTVPWKGPSLLMLLSRTIGQGITVNYLRKSIIADLIHYWKQQDIDHDQVLTQRHRLAHLMGHQYQTQELIYAGYQFMPRQDWSSPEVIQAWIADNL